MARRTRGYTLLVLLALLASQITFAAASAAAPSSASQVDELLKLQRASSDGVITFDTAAFNKYAGQRSRPYSLVVIFTARHLMDKPQLRLRDLRREFGYLGKAYTSEAAAHGKVFLVDVEVGQAQEVVHRLDVKTLPYVFRIPPTLDMEADKLKIPSEEVMQAANYQKYPWSAEDMADFAAERTGVKPGAIEKPSFLKSPLFPLLVLAVLSGGAWLAFKLYYAPFMKNTLIWTTAVIAVYWFSVSGGMHNIIRGVPMQHWDQRSGKVLLFLQQGQGQLGAEGFIMGSLYCTVGLCAALLTQVAPKILQSDKSYQRYAAYGLLLAATFAYLKITQIYLWKTGHRAKWYL